MRQEGLVACQPRPKARTTVPAADLTGRPDLIERNFTADAPARKLVGDITYIHTREGFVYPAGRDGAATRKELLATPWRNTCEPNWSKTLCKWRFGTASPSRV